MEKDLTKHYDPRSVEKRLLNEWGHTDRSTVYDSGDKQPFRVFIAPVSPRSLQDSNTRYMAIIADTIRRFHNLKGRSSRAVYVQPYFDMRDSRGMAGEYIASATDNTGCIECAGTGALRSSLETMKYRLREYYKEIGCLTDFSFMVDGNDRIEDIITETFVSLHDRGVIYHGSKTVPWCPGCRSAVSAEEIQWDMSATPVWFIKYQIPGGFEPILVPISRPELIFGVAAVAVSPDESRFSGIIGSSVMLPLSKRTVPIVASTDVCESNDLGIMHVIPGHDRISAEIADNVGLDSILVVDESGRMVEGFDSGCEGMDRFHCREIVIKTLQTEKLIGRVEKWNTSLGHCRYCDTVIEYRYSPEWFLRSTPLGRHAVSLLQDQGPHFAYDSWVQTYTESMQRSEDWCISRAIDGGIRIPAYTCERCGDLVLSPVSLSVCERCGGGMVASLSTLDPWFSLAMAIIKKDLVINANRKTGDFVPLDLLICARGDISLWVKRVVQLGLILEERIPCDAVFISPEMMYSHKSSEIRESEESKEIDDFIEIFGADVVRFGCSNVLPEPESVNLEEDSLRMLQGFVDKLWNAYRFIRKRSTTFSAADWSELVALQSENRLDLSDRWILSRMNDTVEEMERHMEHHRLSDAAVCIMAFVWRDFCNWYLELARPRASVTGLSGQHMEIVTSVVFSVSIRLFFPFMPFLASELWRGMHSDANDIREMVWPEAILGFRDRTAEHDMEELQDIILTIRKLRGELKIPDAKSIMILIHTPTAKLKDSLTRNAGCIRTLCNVRSLALIDDINLEGPAATAFFGETSLIMPLEGVVDIERERERLERELEKTEQQIIKCRQKLNNVAFLEKAPDNVVQSERNRLEHLEDTRNKFLGFLETL